MSKIKLWTQRELEILIEQVKANPQNLSEAFRQTSKLTGRPANCCSAKWYAMRGKVSPCLFTISEEEGYKNTKIIRKDTKNPNQYNLKDELATFLHTINNIIAKWQQK